LTALAIAPVNAADSYKRWFVDIAEGLRAADRAPRSRSEAARRAAGIRRRMREAGQDAFPRDDARCPLAPEVLGTLEREGYRIERLVFRTRPGCFATATAYVPAGRGPFPGVLCVHGHWQGARRDPVVQSRCIGLAKLGFFALTLDAWGAGERGTRPGQNEYHGGLLGASLWPAGTPLHGLQLWDNVRALDYLQSRPEVLPDRLGCTGASGGGNQTTYLSAFDERVKCAVPVCSVGTFRSYMDVACCVDEVLLGALTFAEEGDLLGCVAPRALMVISASRDSFHFGPQAAAEALERARPVFELHGAGERLRHTVFDSGHDYSRPMREAMYGWMRRWLKDEGDGSPTPEPEFRTEDPESLRCYPGFRPAKVMTTVPWVRERAEILSGEAALRAESRETAARALRELLGLPRRATQPVWKPDGTPETRLLETEPGLALPVLSRTPETGGQTPTVVLLHPGGAGAALETGLAKSLLARGAALYAPELRGCGPLTLPGQALGEGIPDHNVVEWSLWIGRPLLGQWVHDVRQLIRALGGPAAVVGWREGGLAALLAAAVDSRIRAAAALETLATYVTETPPHNQRMAVFQPGLLKVGDVPHLAALSAPRPVLVINPVRLDGMPAGEDELHALYTPARARYERAGRPERLIVRAGVSEEELREIALGGGESKKRNEPGFGRDRYS
jgi:pimeloyl-ACP methyl ester carboxylesterase